MILDDRPARRPLAAPVGKGEPIHRVPYSLPYLRRLWRDTRRVLAWQLFRLAGLLAPELRRGSPLIVARLEGDRVEVYCDRPARLIEVTAYSRHLHRVRGTRAIPLTHLPAWEWRTVTRRHLRLPVMPWRTR